MKQPRNYARRTRKEIPAGRKPTSNASALRRKLLRWYDLHHRDLPWRRTRDAYRIWVSEVMLQQTRVEAVIPYYEKFLQRFPDVNALASANEEAVLACWSGLGYYSRARNLQQAARAIVARHAGEFPRKLEEALDLPGIGDYTAPAVLSIAYGVPLAVLDGNVARVLARLFTVAAGIKTNGGKKKLSGLAAELLSRSRAGDFNQAMMELGATVCLPRQPRCGACPLRADCRAFSAQQVGKYPPPGREKRPLSRRYRAALILDAKGRCLLARRDKEAQWMAGFWELPSEELFSRGPFPAGDAVDGIVYGPLAGHVRHSITTNRLEVAVYRAILRRPARRKTEKWVAPREMERLPVTTITRKALRLFAGSC
jgi:A/G-specific adenine glycosylase